MWRVMWYFDCNDNVTYYADKGYIDIHNESRLYIEHGVRGKHSGLPTRPLLGYSIFYFAIMSSLYIPVNDGSLNWTTSRFWDERTLH